MTNRPRDSEGVVVPLWAEVLMLIMEFREALINKHPKKCRSNSGEQVS